MTETPIQSDALQVALTLRDKAASPAIQEYWQKVVDSIEAKRAQEKKV